MSVENGPERGRGEKFPDLEDMVHTQIDRERLGRYELHELLGSGGMATVYLGRLVGEGGFERWVAIKRIHEHLAPDPSFRDMFLDEARLTASLHHPNLVQVSDFGSQNGRAYLVMEYVEGETLADLLKRSREVGRPLPLPLAARIVAWACDGLHHAHEMRNSDGQLLGLVHRDLSPHNVLISYDGAVKVTDFGVAKASGRRAQTTTAGTVKGKMAFMSPEQVRGRDVDRRSDIFSLGILLFEATLGRPLFSFENELETLQRIAKAVVPRPTQVNPAYPPPLEQILLQALQLDPDARFQTAREMQQELERYVRSTNQAAGTVEVANFLGALLPKSSRRSLATGLTVAKYAVPLASPRATPEEQPTAYYHRPELEPEDSGARPTPQSRRKVALLVGAVILLGAALGVGGTLLSSPSSTSRRPLAIPIVEDRALPEASPAAPSEPSQLASLATLPDAAPPSESEAELNPEPEARGEPLDDPQPESVEHPEAPPQPPGSQGARRRRHPRPRATTTSRPGAQGRPSAGGTGRLSVMATPWCEVLVDGRRAGRTPLVGFSLPAGRHSVELRPRGQPPGTRRSVTIRPDQTTPLSVTLDR